MAIHFDMDQMEQTLSRHMRWWEGALEGPLVSVTIRDAYPSKGKAAAPRLSQATCADFSWTPEQLIEKLDEDLSACAFLGDAYPYVNFDAFGPGVLAAFCGARLDNASGGVWFFPREQQEIADIHVCYDPDNVWAQRIKAIYHAGTERWGGLVVMGMPDLGGVLDVAATLRGSESLLMDLYDDADEVIRLAEEIQVAWQEAYRDFARVLHPAITGYSDWSGLLSRTPSYIIQCDLSYMIGNDMFRQFVLPTLTRDLAFMPNCIYHLDGIGELKHLDTLLELKALKAVQWVFGDGQPGPMSWLDVYRKIKAADKNFMVCGEPEEICQAIQVLGGKGAYANVWLPAAHKERASRLLALR